MVEVKVDVNEDAFDEARHITARKGNVISPHLLAWNLHLHTLPP